MLKLHCYLIKVGKQATQWDSNQNYLNSVSRWSSSVWIWEDTSLPKCLMCSFRSLGSRYYCHQPAWGLLTNFFTFWILFLISKRKTKQNKKMKRWHSVISNLPFLISQQYLKSMVLLLSNEKCLTNPSFCGINEMLFLLASHILDLSLLSS